MTASISDRFTVQGPRWGGRAQAAAAAGVALLLSLPWWAEPATLRWLVEAACFVVLAQMWNLVAGYGGLVSVGQQAFVGVGGYTLFLAAQHLGVPPFLAVACGGVGSALVAALTARAVFRLQGGYFAIATWVVAEVLRIGFSNASLLGGGSGQSLTVMARIPRTLRESGSFWMACGLLLGTLACMALLLRSRFGLALTAVRDSESAAASQGVDVQALKFRIYVASAFGSGLAGALYFMTVLRISPAAAFDLQWAVAAIFMAVIGGIGTLEGPLLGAAIFFGLRWLLADHGGWYWIALGGVALGVMTVFPKGLWGWLHTRYGWELVPLRRQVREMQPATVAGSRPESPAPPASAPAG